MGHAYAYYLSKNYIVLKNFVFFTNFPKKCKKIEHHEKLTKTYFIDGECLYAYYLSKNYIVLQNKTRKHKVNRYVSRQKNVKVKKYSKIMPDLVCLELIPLNGWLVCCFWI